MLILFVVTYETFVQVFPHDRIVFLRLTSQRYFEYKKI